MNQSSSVNTGLNFINMPMTSQPSVSQNIQSGGPGSFSTGNGNAITLPNNTNANTGINSDQFGNTNTPTI